MKPSPNSVTSEKTLVILDGTIPSVLAAWREAVCRPGAASDAKPVLWHPSELTRAQKRAVHSAAGACGIGEVIAGPVSSGATGMAANVMLLAAGAEAIARGLGKIVWPIQIGGHGNDLGDERHFAAVASAFDRALLAARLLTVDAGATPIVIETPFVDLSDFQLLDLAADLDAPVGQAWWCERATGESSSPCGSCGSCLRWMGAMKQAGIVPGIARLNAVAEAKPAGVGGVVKV